MIRRRVSKLLGAAVLAALLSGCGGESSDEVRIEPADALLDAPLRLEVDGVEGRVPLRLTMFATSFDGVRWSGTQTVPVAEERTVSVDGETLLASLRPEGARAGARDVGLFPKGNELELRLSARQGDRELGEAHATRRFSTPDVTTRDLSLADDGLVGRFSASSDGSQRVAVLLLGGSEGGLRFVPTETLLAARGYPVLRLAYFRAEGLPQTLEEIPLEYFERALTWLHRETGGARIVIVGSSRGGELALILGARFPRLVDGVAAYAPSSVVHPAPPPATGPAWTYRGEPLETVAPTEFGDATPTNGSAIIPVERIRGPVLTVAGVVDTLWPAASYAAAVERRRKEHRKETETLVFQEAGHGVGAQVPSLPLWLLPLDFAETRRADALARTEAWRRLLVLLDRVATGG